MVAPCTTYLAHFGVVFTHSISCRACSRHCESLSGLPVCELAEDTAGRHFREQTDHNSRTLVKGLCATNTTRPSLGADSLRSEPVLEQSNQETTAAGALLNRPNRAKTLDTKSVQSLPFLQSRRDFLNRIRLEAQALWAASKRSTRLS